MTTKLEELFKDQSVLNKLIDVNKKEIMKEQIVRKEYLLFWNFKLLIEKDNLATYERTSNNVTYRLMLNYTKPNLVCFERVKQNRVYGFVIESVEEFNELLVFLNIG